MYLFNTIEKKIAFYKIWEKERVDISVVDPDKFDSESFGQSRIQILFTKADPDERRYFIYYVDKDGEGRGKVRPYFTTKAAA